GIKVIIEMHAIHIIPADQFPDDGDQTMAHFRNRRVINLDLFMIDHPIRRNGWVKWRIGDSSTGSCGNTVWIEPGMELDPPCMGFPDHEIQDIISRIC